MQTTSTSATKTSRSGRTVKTPERYDSLTFLHGSNNGHTVGRRIDSGQCASVGRDYDRMAIRAISKGSNLKGFVVSDKTKIRKEPEPVAAVEDEEEEWDSDAETEEEEDEWDSDAEESDEEEDESDSDSEDEEE